ncbi:co-chaperone GroES [candidate division KSB1 bacterium 4484_188]|nr:MAG: co-chaperone GroES [candidate division KSB1 bacterium 4484_188]HFE64274.1 co-chaperone GroES [Caldithrix sp.]
MKIQPIDDRLLVELIEEEEERVGSIIIPDTAKEKPRMGNVVAVGTDEDLKEIFKEGDKVLFAKYGGDEIKLDNKEYIILQRSDVLAIVK